VLSLRPQATYMANHARTLIKANGLESVIEVFQCTAEELQLPEQVDIVISEWMGASRRVASAAPRASPALLGYFLLRESMLDSVLKARDKWMKPGGSMCAARAARARRPLTPPQVPQPRAHAAGAHPLKRGPQEGGRPVGEH